METPFLGLELIEDGETNWGEKYRNALRTIDQLGLAFPRTLGRYHIAGMCNATDLTTSSVSSNVLRVLPLVLLSPATTDRMALRVHSASGNARLGIYKNADPLIYPGELLVDVGEVYCGATGKREAMFNPVDLTPGLWWVAIVTSSSPTLYCVRVGAALPILGFSSTITDSSSPGVGWSVSHTYGKLPQTFPTSGAAPITAQPIPAVYVYLY